MTNFTVPFNRHDFSISFQANSTPIEFELEVKQKIEQVQPDNQLKTEEILNQIKNGFEQVQTLIKRSQDQIGAMAFLFAEQFVRCTFDNDVELIESKIKSQIESTLSKMEVPVEVAVFVHPEILQSLSNKFQTNELSELNIQPDPLLEKSDCRVEGPECGWISRIERQLEIARDSVFASMEPNES